MTIRSIAAMLGQITLTAVAMLAITAVTPLNDAAAQKSQGGVTLMKNIDEPGRLPYRAYLEFSMPAGCNVATDCANFRSGFDATAPGNNVVLLDGPVVPAGKRLVINWVSAVAPVEAQDVSLISLSLQSTQSFTATNLFWQFHGPWYRSSNYRPGMTSEAFVTYGPGERPHVRIATTYNLSDFPAFVFNVTLSGYLIDATN